MSKKAEDVTQGYTHQKRPYQATCTQVTLESLDEVIGLIRAQGDDAVMFKDCIMVRYAQDLPDREHISTIQIGWWVVVGENGVLKCYDDATFKIKYEEIK